MTDQDIIDYASQLVESARNRGNWNLTPTSPWLSMEDEVKAVLIATKALELMPTELPIDWR